MFDFDNYQKSAPGGTPTAANGAQPTIVTISSPHRLRRPGSGSGVGIRHPAQASRFRARSSIGTPVTPSSTRQGLTQPPAASSSYRTAQRRWSSSSDS